MDTKTTCGSFGAFIVHRGQPTTDCPRNPNGERMWLPSNFWAFDSGTLGVGLGGISFGSGHKSTATADHSPGVKKKNSLMERI